MADKHWVEMVSDRLADAIQFEIDMLASYLRPKGDRPPFSERVGLEWWAKHRTDAYGRKLVAMMEPVDVMALDAALAERAEAQAMAPPRMVP